MMSSIQRLDLTKCRWETLKNVKLPRKLGFLQCVLDDGMVHCMGGESDGNITCNNHFIIDLKHLLPENYENFGEYGAINIFCNWLRKSGFFKIEVKGIGRIVSKYTGSLWGNYDKFLEN